MALVRDLNCDIWYFDQFFVDADGYIWTCDVESTSAELIDREKTPPCAHLDFAFERPSH